MIRILTLILLLTSATTLTGAMKDGEMELLLVHAVWRHGDRSPIEICPTDPIQENDWTFGGGGFGQLSPLGMAQHMKLGKLVRSTYIDTGFLSKKYSSKEIYVRSTDLNRTLISAMSNMLGMYGQYDHFNEAGVDYPSETGWPAGYVPVPIHTVKFETDHVGNPETKCERHSLLWNMAKNSSEVQSFLKRPDVAELLRQLTEYCGKTINMENFWSIYDSLFVEQIHRNERLRAENKWFTDELFSKIKEVEDQFVLYENGLFDKTITMNNLDIGLEIVKLRGGSLFNEINSRMNMKIDCMNRVNAACSWINSLKYYAYSAHDTTVHAFLSVLDIPKEVIDDGGNPRYAAAVFIELWMNQTDNQPYFKLLYHSNAESEILYSITHFIDPCGPSIYCKLDIFKDFAARAKPDEPIKKWCDVDPRIPRKASMSSTSSTPSWTISAIAFVVLSRLWLSAVN
ncbi:hypothetical protein KIN20_032683 [Parelaphostrongylus tenuis]|uniref:acid phosphatase n=1 Tax=Parelaphostrongylus tenuis TaxID=148309 RepID=A0AAD5R7K4_PARTN|nr:hypothetical protein KIN20_032683 [Parelaphostrongylus tenuis]